MSPPLTILAALLVAAGIATTATPAYTQNLDGTLIGNITDAQGAHVPGVTVTIKDENTGLELSGVTDPKGTYTIRNITRRNLHAEGLAQGFKEFVETGIPFTAGGIVRINDNFEVGALDESVTVTTEAPPRDRQRRPASTSGPRTCQPALNQYGTTRDLMNLVPGATPPSSRTPRPTHRAAPPVNVNGIKRNNNVTRIDGAACINVWLPHHVGYVAPVETIENVNISTNSFTPPRG